MGDGFNFKYSWCSGTDFENNVCSDIDGILGSMVMFVLWCVFYRSHKTRAKSTVSVGYCLLAAFGDPGGPACKVSSKSNQLSSYPASDRQSNMSS